MTVDDIKPINNSSIRDTLGHLFCFFFCLCFLLLLFVCFVVVVLFCLFFFCFYFLTPHALKPHHAHSKLRWCTGEVGVEFAIKTHDRAM